LGQGLAWAQQRLGGHAAVEGALAAHEALLDDGDVEAGLGQAPGAHLPCGTGTDDHDVEAALAHGAQSTRQRSALQGRAPCHPAAMPRSATGALLLVVCAATALTPCG